MSETTKIEFSPYQWQCLNDTSFFKAKSENMLLLNNYLGALSTLYADTILKAGKQYILSGLSALSPKISKGENHLGLPYINLDYPRILDNEHNFLIVRTFFWWGTCISLQLIAGGIYTQYVSDINTYTGAWLTTNKEALWNNTFEPPDFSIVHSESKLLSSYPFIKIAYKWPLQDFNNPGFTSILLDKFKLLVIAAN